MKISELDQVMCENRNAELLIQEVYRINPSIKFTILDDMITEHEALVLYNTLCNNNALEETKRSCQCLILTVNSQSL